MSLTRKMPLRRSALKRSSLSPLRKSRLKQQSAKRQKAAKEYAKLRTEYLLAHPECELFLSLEEKEDTESAVLLARIWPTATQTPLATQIHHKLRRRKNYLNVKSFMAVSAEAHRYIEEHPSWSRANGYLA